MCRQGPRRWDHFGLVESDDRFSQRVIVRVADATHGRLGSRFGQSLGVANRQILATPVAVMHDPLDSGTRPQRLLQRVQDQFGMHRARHAPADDAPGEYIDHERNVYEAGPRRDESKVRHPQLIGTARLELPVDSIERSLRTVVGDGGAALATAHHPLQTERAHQPLDRTAGNLVALAAKLPPDFARTVDTEILLVHATNLRYQCPVALQPRWQARRLCLARLVLVILRWGDRQLRADRLDPVNSIDGHR